MAHQIARQPMQKVYKDVKGTIRFVPNQIVDKLLEFSTSKGFDLNQIAIMEFSQEDRQQFAQLIGYSVLGYHELSYVSDKSATYASKKAKGIDPEFEACRDGGCEIHCGVPDKFNRQNGRT